MPDIDRKCLFHADRPQFDKLERELTASNLLPRCNSHRLASAICSCNKEKDQESYPSEKEFESHMMRFRAMLRKEEQRLSTFSTAYITNILDSSDPTDYSRRRLLDVLSSAQAGDFSLLIDIRELTRTRDDPVILTEKQFEIMMREKKKHMESDENAPPVFSKSTCTLEPKVQVSKRVKFSKSGCFIHTMTHERTLRSFNNKVNMTYIEIWNENEGAIDSVDNYIRKSNREAKERTDYIYKPKQSRKQKRSRKQLNYIDDEQDFYYEGLDFKERRERDFALKVEKNKEYQRAKAKIKIPGNIAGRCEKCLQFFYNVNTQDECVHHPGAIVKGVWSCCWEPAFFVNDLLEDHARSGCEEGTHKFRIPKHYSKRQSRRNEVSKRAIQEPEPRRRKPKKMRTWKQRVQRSLPKQGPMRKEPAKTGPLSSVCTQTTSSSKLLFPWRGHEKRLFYVAKNQTYKPIASRRPASLCSTK